VSLEHDPLSSNLKPSGQLVHSKDELPLQLPQEGSHISQTPGYLSK
jgi:hypothetical protein